MHFYARGPRLEEAWKENRRVCSGQSLSVDVHYPIVSFLIYVLLQMPPKTPPRENREQRTPPAPGPPNSTGFGINVDGILENVRTVPVVDMVGDVIGRDLTPQEQLFATERFKVAIIRPLLQGRKPLTRKIRECLTGRQTRTKNGRSKCRRSMKCKNKTKKDKKYKSRRVRTRKI